MLTYETYGRELHERRMADFMQEVEHKRQVREAEAANSLAQNTEPDAVTVHLSLARRALAGAGAWLVRLGQRLEGAAQQPAV